MSRPTVAEIARVLEIAGDMYWRQRFGLAQTADVVIVRLKDPASTSPVGHQLERDRAGAKAGSAYPFPRVDPTCAVPGDGALGADHDLLAPRRRPPHHAHTPTTTKENYR